MPDWTFRLLRVLGWLTLGFLTSLAVAWGACIAHANGGWRRTVFSEGRSAQRFCGADSKGKPDRFGQSGDRAWAGPYFELFADLIARTGTASRAGPETDSFQIIEFGNRGWGVRTTQIGCTLLTESGWMPGGFDLEFLRIDAGWPMPAWSTAMEISGNSGSAFALGGPSVPMETRVLGDAGTLFRKNTRRNLASDVWPTASGVPLPFFPLWLGAAINTLTCTGLWLGASTALRGLRGLARRRRGLCPRCGYASKGLPTCPECGAAGRVW